MPIINSSVTQGSEVKTSDASTTTYIADQVVFSFGGVNFTQRQVVSSVVAFLAAWALKS